MPNGRSGGFPIDTKDLKRIASDVANRASVGMVALEGSPGLRAVGGAEILQLVEECSAHRVAVEEQDHSSYIIHLSNEPIAWVSVGPDSPIFAELKQRHSQWETEHPKWKGWIGF